MNWCRPCDADILVDEAETILECNYDTDVTSLYQAIEAEAWDPILTFIKTQKWSYMTFSKDRLSPECQARTWVTRFDPKGKVRWSQLPLHAAIIFRAPRKVVKALIELYPLSVQCTDDQRMLPLHLAFRVGADDSIMNFLLRCYPDALLQKDQHGKFPYTIEGNDIRKDYNESVYEVVKLITQKVTASEQKSSRLEINDVEDAMKDQSRLVTIMEDDNKNLINELADVEKELAEFRNRCRMLEKIIEERESTSVPDATTRLIDSLENYGEPIATTAKSDPKDTKAGLRHDMTTDTVRNLNHSTRSHKLSDRLKKKDQKVISSEKFDFGNTSLETKDTETTASQCTVESAKISIDPNLIQKSKEPEFFPDTIKQDNSRVIHTNEYTEANTLFNPEDSKISANHSIKKPAQTSANLKSIQHGDEELEVVLNDIKQTLSRGSEIAMKYKTKEKLINSKPSFIMRESTEDLIDVGSVKRTPRAEKEISESQKNSHPRKYLADERQNADLTGMAVKIHEDQQYHALYDVIQTIVTSYQKEPN